MGGAADGTSTGVPRLYHIAANADMQSSAEQHFPSKPTYCSNLNWAILSMRIESRWALPQKPKLESLNLGQSKVYPLL
jgi:hypothetical protein